ncbi:MAG: PEP-CTERM sorting domain-containing protein [Planctomycetota bacterium]
MRLTHQSISALGLFLAAANASAQSFMSLGVPDDALASYPAGISADGTTVVGTYTASGNASRAFRWTSAGGFEDLGTLTGETGTALGLAIDADGTTAAGWSNNFSQKGFVWTAPGPMIEIPSLPGGQDSSSAQGISDDGVVVVGFAWSEDASAEPFRWTPGTGIVGLGFLPDPGSFPQGQSRAANADGSIVVGEASANFNQRLAFRWTESEGMVSLGDLPGGQAFSGAYAVTADGSVVVGFSSSTSGFEAFRWTEADGMVGIGDAPGGNFSSIAYDVSDDGTVIVGESDTANGSEAFVWTAGTGVQPLREVLTGYGIDLTGWTLRDAQGISADGRTIVGDGINPMGMQVGWIATIPPQACSIADVTTTGGTLPGQPGFGIPDARIDLDDLGFFLNVWLLGCD